MQETELVARLANAFVEYQRARTRSEAAACTFRKLASQEEGLRLLILAGGDRSNDLIEQDLDDVYGAMIGRIEECEARDRITRLALQQISRIGMLADGQTLGEIDAHFQKEDAEFEANRRLIRRRIAESVDKNL